MKWAPQPAGKDDSREVIGYYAEAIAATSGPCRSPTGNLGVITTVAPFSYRIDRRNIHGQTNPELLKTAQTNGLKTLAMITNIQGTNFSRDADQRHAEE